MYIIEYEGLDKCGKHTQSVKLTERLTKMGYKVVQSEFHRYDTPTGKLIKRYLYNQWNSVREKLAQNLVKQWIPEHYDVEKDTIELLMAADKIAQQGWFDDLEKEGVDFLILDRYIPSQLCFGKAKGFDMGWLNSLYSKAKYADISILIDIEPEVSISRKGKHGRNDRYEDDIVLLTKAREAYLKYFRRTNKIIIDGTSKKSKKDIANLIEFEVVSRLHLKETQHIL